MDEGTPDRSATGRVRAGATAEPPGAVPEPSLRPLAVAAPVPARDAGVRAVGLMALALLLGGAAAVWARRGRR